MRRLCVLFLVVVLVIGVLPIYASAACSHNNYTPIYSEASHPHRYFKQCKTCLDIIFTGGSATKAHGDGSWGSGTCPNCGTHTYVGTTCTTSAESQRGIVTIHKK